MIPGLEGLTPFRLIGILAGLAMASYVFIYWIWPNIQSFVGGSQKMPEERAAALMEQYMRDRNEIEGVSRDFSLAAPKFSVLRTGRKEDTLMCIIANRGGTATNLHVETTDRCMVTVEPRAMLKSDETARIQLRGIEPGIQPTQFELSYDDSYGHRNRRVYTYTGVDATFKEV